MRKLASIQRIVEIKPIEGADLIQAYRIDGWWVVDKKGAYQVGDLAIYLEVDSFVPTELAPFLSKGKEPRVYNGIKGERLRTVRLRKQISQGLLLNPSILGDTHINFFNGSGRWAIGVIPEGDDKFSEFLFEGDDVTERLGIQKWEPPPEFSHADAKGLFPSFIPKTDQDRIQNIGRNIEAAKAQNLKFEVTEKLEGSSLTAFLFEDQFGVCSRNLELKRSEDNTFWATAIRYGLEEKLRSLGREIALQGELIGPGIQGNIYKLTQFEFHIFDVYDIRAGKYLLPAERRALLDALGLIHAPVIETEFELTTVPEMIKMADGLSALYETLREGIVFKQIDGDMTFKAISNEYLIKEK